jgi:hypothetical protein
MSGAVVALRDRYKPFLPDKAADAAYLRDLLDGLASFSFAWMRQTGRHD